MQGYDIRIPKLLGGLKTMRKTLSIVLSLLMVLSIFSPVFAEEDVKDVTAETIEKNEEFIEFLKEQNIIEGDKSGDLMLDKDIDRASFAAILVRADGKDAVAKSVATLPSKFADMTAAHWANGYATVAHDNLWMKGNPANEFMPGNKISYAEIATTLVRYLGEEKDGMVYPTSYIAKATELGLFEGTEEIAGEYTKNAVRRNVFMMLYNALSRDDFGKYTVYKMIVLENSRVAQLGKNEIKAEVMSVVQIANNVSERYSAAKVGQQMVFDIEKVKVEHGIADTEYLLGKVANFTVDQNGKLVKVTVDHKDYKYYFGDFKASADGKKLDMDGAGLFNVRFDERYYRESLVRGSERDDRVYRTYITDGWRAENFNYYDFAERLNLKKGDSKKLNANFARITVRDGMVLFVDAYSVFDIAPVAEVKRDGRDVYFYNDMRNGSVDRMTPADRVIGYTAEKEFYNMDEKDIKKDDVIHMLKGLTLVRQDAPVVGKLNKTFIDRRGEFAVIAEKEYWLSSVVSKTPEYLRSVYAYDDQHYRTTESRGNINGMVNDDVKALLDIAGNIQLITSNKELTDTIGMVRKWNSNYPVFAAPNAGKDYNLDVVRGTNFLRGKAYNDTGVQREAEFQQFDILYTIGGEDNKAELLAGFVYRDEYAAGMKKAKFEDKFHRYLQVGDKQYRYDDDTRVFVVNNIRGEVAPFNFSKAGIVPATMETVAKYNEGNEKLQAYVINEKDLRAFIEGTLDINRYNLYGDREDLAKVVVFTGYNGPKADLKAPEFARVKRVYNYATSVTLEINRGEFVDFVVTTNADRAFLSSLRNGDVVVYQEFKDKEERTATFPEEYNIPKATAAGEIESDGYVGQNGVIKVAGRKFYTTKYTKVFGDVNYKYAKVYATLNDADAIVYLKNNPAPVEETLSGIVTEVGDGFIVVDGSTVYITTDKTILRDEKGKVLQVAKELTQLKVNDVVEVTTNNKNEALEVKRIKKATDRGADYRTKAQERMDAIAEGSNPVAVNSAETLKAAKEAVAKADEAPALTDTERTFLSERTSPKGSDYDTAENNLKTTKENIAKYEALENFRKAMKDITPGADVTLDDEAKVKEARAEYNKLNAEQAAEVTTEKGELDAAEAKIKALKELKADLAKLALEVNSKDETKVELEAKTGANTTINSVTVKKNTAGDKATASGNKVTVDRTGQTEDLVCEVEVKIQHSSETTLKETKVFTVTVPAAVGGEVVVK